MAERSIAGCATSCRGGPGGTRVLPRLTSAGVRRAACTHVGVPERSALVTALIIERPTCLNCIGERAGLPLDAVDTVLTVIARVLHLNADREAVCRHCGELGVVFWISALKD